MISIIINQNHDKQYVGFSTKGHANYSSSGTDIICAAVSAMTINAVNSIEKFTDNKFKVDYNQTDGAISFKFLESPDEKAELLIESMILGLQGIKKDYGKRYISIEFKEV